MIQGGAPVCFCAAGHQPQGLTCQAIVDSCTGQTCSGHGSCGIFAGVAKCSCDSNFYLSTVDNLQCLDARSAVCPPAACSGHGICNYAIAGTTPFGYCQCEAGYQATRDTPPRCVDPCAGQTCSGHGQCAYVPPSASTGSGGAQCFCDPGFKPTGTLQCTEGCGGPCAAGSYCDFTSDSCKTLPADGIQSGLPGSKVSFNAIASNSAGDVYVAGAYSAAPSPTSATDHLDSRSLFAKFGSDKTLAWTYSWGASFNYSVVHALAVDSGGNFYTAGTTDYRSVSTNVAQGNGEIVKWDPAGNKLWTFKYPLTTDGNATGAPAGIAVGPGPSFDIYIVGWVWGRFNGQGTAGSLSDAFLMKIRGAGPGTGSIAWTKVFGPAGDSTQDKAYGVAVDPASGDVFVTGTISANIAGGTGHTGGQCNWLGCEGTTTKCNDAYVTRWRPDGTTAWTKYYGLTNQSESGAAITVAGGSVYVAGTTAKASGSRNPFLWKLSATDGAQTWAREVPVTAVMSGRAPMAAYTGVAVGPTGTVYTVGSTSGDYEGQMAKDRTGMGSDAIFTIWDAAGSRLSSRLWSSDSASSESVTGVALGGTPAKAYISGNNAINFTQEGANASFVIYTDVP